MRGNIRALPDTRQGVGVEVSKHREKYTFALLFSIFCESCEFTILFPLASVMILTAVVPRKERFLGVFAKNVWNSSSPTGRILIKFDI